VSRVIVNHKVRPCTTRDQWLDMLQEPLEDLFTRSQANTIDWVRNASTNDAIQGPVMELLLVNYSLKWSVLPLPQPCLDVPTVESCLVKVEKVCALLLQTKKLPGKCNLLQAMLLLVHRVPAPNLTGET
jgi:hypothetical protein